MFIHVHKIIKIFKIKMIRINFLIYLCSKNYLSHFPFNLAFCGFGPEFGYHLKIVSGIQVLKLSTNLQNTAQPNVTRYKSENFQDFPNHFSFSLSPVLLIAIQTDLLNASLSWPPARVWGIWGPITPLFFIASLLSLIIDT